ncbi:S8 family peptidase [Miltoncostaea marina]|uniref:S8 family peptidase n=1 Tax=Miltoncostaea marina TaxID=2843215 RepID=UPI001C3E66C7|nr:S8 family peptidase [Miltoncostaea marina]
MGPRARRAAAAWAVAVLALGAAAGAANAAARAADAAARTDSLLVKVDPGAPPDARARVGRALGADAARPLMAGWRVYELPEAISVERARALLAGLPAAESVQPDPPLRALEATDDPRYGLQWALPRIGAPVAWAADAGAEEVVVAVVDEGVQTDHPDLAGRIWTNPGEIPGNGADDDGNGYVDDVRGWNFALGSPTVFDPAGGDAHGTHVAGIIAARRGDATGVAGVTANAVIMPLTFMRDGSGLTSHAIAAIRYAVRNGARVVNASWGGDAYSPALCDAVAEAGAAGVLVVAAAGNDGRDIDEVKAWPASCPAPDLVTVAATDEDDAPAGFSNLGVTSVDLGAPGTAIHSTLPAGGWGWMSGTSMAAPHVSGAAALVLGLRPGLAPWQVRSALLSGGAPVAALDGRTASGRRLDMAGALTRAGVLAPDTTPPEPFALLAPADGLVVPAGAVAMAWSASADAASGLAGYRLLIDGAVVARPSAPRAAVAGLADGVHHWSVVAVDRAGNARAAAGRALVIDTAPPSAALPVAPVHGARAAGPAVRLAWRPATDATSGLAAQRLLVDGRVAAVLPPSAAEHRLTLARGAHLWQVVAVDAAGHETAGPPRALTVIGAAGAARRPARGRLTLRAPARLAAGRAPLLRVRLARPARVTVRVGRAGAARPVAVLARRMPAGATPLRLPRGVARRMAVRPGAYVVLARAPGGLRDSVRVTVTPRRR